MLIKSLAVVMHCLYGLVLYSLFPLVSVNQKQRSIRDWHQRLLNIFQINVVVKGALDISKLATGPKLIVANHISWLDIHVLAAQIAVTFVAKSDVKDWPLFGRFAKSVGTIFLNRNKPSDIKRVLQEMIDGFTLNQVICIFPEGTSSTGEAILPFKSNLFEAAVDTTVSTIPILIQYQLNGRFTDIPAYYGDMTLIESILKILKTPQITAIITVSTPLPLQDSRSAYCHAARLALTQALI